MSKIMELADAYATEKLMSAWIPTQHKVTHARIEAEARAALAAEVEKLEAESTEMALIGVRSVADVLALREKLALVEKDAARWRYTQKKGYFICGPTDYEGDWMGYVVGVQRKGKSVNESVQGRGDTLVDAIDAAMGATK